MSEAALAGNMGSNVSMQLTFSSNSAGKTDQMATQAFQQFGGSAVGQSVNNIAAGTVGEVVNGVIDSLPMPDFMKDVAKQQVAQALSSFEAQTPAGLDQTIEIVLSQPSTSGSDVAASSSAVSASDIASELGSIMGRMLQSEMSGGSEEGGNWLAVLARALGETAGEHLKKMVELGEKMGEMDSTENPEEFAKVQAEFQAESQIFKMFQEAIGTMVKSIGEGMSTVARKQ